MKTIFFFRVKEKKEDKIIFCLADSLEEEKTTQSGL